MHAVGRLRLAVALAAVVGVVCALPLAGPAHAAEVHAPAAVVTSTPMPDGDSFHPVTPVRLLDTRTGTGRPGGVVAKVGPGETIDLQVTGRGDVPLTGASGVVLNITAVSPSLSTYVTVWPTGSARPTTSNLNVGAGRVRPNLVELQLGTGGRVSLFNQQGTVDLIADLAGWVGASLPADPGGEQRSLEPSRLLDTRTGIGTANPGASPAGGVIDLQVLGRGGVPADHVGAVVLNVTATAATARAFVTAWPKGVTRPLASNLNVIAGQTVPNRVIVKVGNDGAVSLFHDLGSVHLIVDVTGYFTDAVGTDVVGAAFTGISPVRFTDTRLGTGTPKVKLKAGESLRVPIAGLHGVPTMESAVPPTAVVANVTVTNPTAAAPAYATVWPSGRTRPLASDLNYVAGETVPNLVVGKLGADGAIEIYNSAGSVDVIVDVFGWYAGDVVLDPDLVVLDGTEAAAVTAVGPSTVTFGSKTGAIADLHPGSVIVSGPSAHAPDGFLRTVTNVEPGGLAVDTTDATLADALEQGALDETADATAPGLASLGRPVATDFGGSAGGQISVPLAHDFGFGATTSGSFTVGAGVDVSLDVGWTGLHAASLIAHAEESFDAQLDVVGTATWSGDLPLGEVKYEPIVFEVGPVPVEVRPVLNATLHAEGSASASLHARVTQSETLRAGVEYADGALAPVQDRTSVPPTFSGPTIDGEAAGKVAVVATLDAEFYGGVANLSVGIGPYLRVKADLCHAQLFVGIDGLVHADISILGFDKAYDESLTLGEVKLADIQLPGCWHGSITFHSAFDQNDPGHTTRHIEGDSTWTILGPAEEKNQYIAQIHAEVSDVYTTTIPDGPCQHADLHGTLDGTGIIYINDSGSASYQVTVWGPSVRLTGPVDGLIPECGSYYVGTDSNYFYGSSTWNGLDHFTDQTVGPLAFDGTTLLQDEHYTTASYVADAIWTFTRGN